MKLDELLIRNIGLFNRREITFSDSITIIEGPNASGKSTILNSILFLCHMPVKTINQLKKNDNKSDFIGARGIFSYKNESIPMIVEAIGGINNGKFKKKYLLNKIETSRSQIKPFPSCVIFNPEMVALFNSSLSNQRRFWIRCIEMLDSSFTSNWNRYLAIVRNRNSILKRIREGKALVSHLNVWSEKMIESASVIEEQMVYWIGQIDEYVSKLSKDIKIDLEIVHISELEAHLKNNFTVDIERGYTVLGSHFFTISVLLDDQNIAIYGSRGQSKVVCVEIIVALSNLLYELLDEYPILLIDDMGAELDSENIKIIEKMIKNSLQQKIITTINRQSLPAQLNGEFITLD